MSKVKVKIAADTSTAAALRVMVRKYANAELASTPEEVQLMAWLLEMSREITMAQADRLSLAASDRGHEMVLPR
jgi:CRP-like cAMP-binding protein